VSEQKQQSDELTKALVESAGAYVDTQFSGGTDYDGGDKAAVPTVQTLYGEITGDKVNLRQNADKSSKSLGLLDKGTKVEVLDKGEVKTAGGLQWYKVKHQTAEGYVAAQYLELTLPSLGSLVVAGAGKALASESETKGLQEILTGVRAAVTAACFALVPKIPKVGPFLAPVLCPLLDKLMSAMIAAIGGVDFIEGKAKEVLEGMTVELACFIESIDLNGDTYEALLKDQLLPKSKVTKGGRFATYIAKASQKCGLHPFVANLLLSQWYAGMGNKVRAKRYLDNANAQKESYAGYLALLADSGKLLKLDQEEALRARRVLNKLYADLTKGGNSNVKQLLGADLPSNEIWKAWATDSTTVVTDSTTVAQLCSKDSNAAAGSMLHVANQLYAGARGESQPYTKYNGTTAGIAMACGRFTEAALRADHALKVGKPVFNVQIPDYPKVDKDEDKAGSSALPLAIGLGVAYFLFSS